MKYDDGKDVCVGDRVKLWSGMFGTVVSDFDKNRYLEGYSAEDWSDHPVGVLILSDSDDLFHYEKLDEDMELLNRGITAPRA